MNNNLNFVKYFLITNIIIVALVPCLKSSRHKSKCWKKHLFKYFHIYYGPLTVTSITVPSRRLYINLSGVGEASRGEILNLCC